MREVVMTAPQTAFRQDIEILRAFAISLVVLYHTKLFPGQGGYLGVDIFFVVSGYLITGLIAKGIQAGRFSFTSFYASRARRLIPPALVVYLATAAASKSVLDESILSNANWTLVGALTFTSNIFLWRQSGYFSSDASLNPLLHTWSLSVEEQFYLLVPVLMWLTARKMWLVGSIALAVSSGIACLLVLERSPSGAFYLLPSRAWELAIGACVAIGSMTSGRSLQRICSRLMGPAILVLVSVPLFSPMSRIGIPHPAGDALLVCLSTAILIAGRGSEIHLTGPFVRSAVWVGGLSYSLYLVHWPLVAFANNVWMTQDVPWAARIAILVVSLLLAWLLKRAVEDPFRRTLPADGSKAKLVLLGAILVSLVSACALASRLDARKTEEALWSRPNHGLGPGCESVGAFRATASCSTGSTPGVLIWGDSFAMHLVEPIQASGPMTIVQATMSSCSPSLGLAQVSPEKGLTDQWAISCVEFNESVIEYLRQNPTIRTVVIGSLFSQLSSTGARGLEVSAGKRKVISLSPQAAERALLLAVNEAQALGVRVILVGPTPTNGYDVGRCYSRREDALPTMGVPLDCSIDRAKSEQLRAPALRLLRTIKERTNAEFIDLHERLCDKTTCITRLGEIPIYRDAGHFSVDGGKALRQHGLIRLPDASNREPEIH